jgi:hypothetical protein
LVGIVTEMAWTLTAAPEMLLVTVKGMMPGAMPPIGFSMGVVIFRVMPKMSIWSGLGLGPQGV